MTDAYTIEFATPADDAAIRRLLASNPVPGAVTVTYEREPSYFPGCATMGHFCQVAVCRHQPSGAVVGLSCRAARPMFVNGQAEEVGYLGQLRIDPAHQGRWLLSRAFQHLREWHNDGRVAGYITTIIEDNAIAEGVLVRRARRHFPIYRELDRLCTLALVVTRLPLRRRVCPAGAPAYTISRGSEATPGEIAAFLRECGAARQFFPVYDEADFCDNPLTRDFQMRDFVIARHGQGGALVGVLGLWDQARYKQTVIHSYHGSLRRLRPAYNLGARLLGAPPLPPPGGHLRYAYASFGCVRQDDPAIFAALLWQVYRMAAERGYSYLMLGLTTSDPLLPVARRYPHLAYYSRLYTVDWPDAPRAGLHARLDGRTPYIELATL
jgi:GNAT superfamily N-acetyltransferase